MTLAPRRALTALAAVVALLAATFGVGPFTSTPATAASCYDTYLSLGSRGTCVKAVQRRLGNLAVDGVYGSRTRDRVKAFQRDAGIGVDGKVGPQTWGKIRRYGKALAWVSGATLFMCEESSTRLRISVWNNHGSSIVWQFSYDNGSRYTHSRIADDRIARYDQFYLPGTASHDSKRFRIWYGSNLGKYRTDWTPRDFSRRTLPTCG